MPVADLNPRAAHGFGQVAPTPDLRSKTLFSSRTAMPLHPQDLIET